MSLYRAFRFLLFRLPILSISLFFLLLAWLSPGQIELILRDSWQYDGLLARFALFVPLIVAGALHLILLSARTKIVNHLDFVFASIPLAAIAGMVLYANPSNLVISLLALAIGLTIFWWTTRRLSSNALNISPQPVGIFIVALWIAAALLVIASPIAVPKALGLSIVTIGLSLIGLVFALALLWPRTFLFYAAICTAAAFFGPHQNTVPLVDGKDRTSFELEEGLRAWLASRKDVDAYNEAKRPYPVVVASSEGGGIYAAAHSYMVLSALQGICPSFADHLFATVGVSGGGVGNLLFRASISDSKPRSLLPCHKPTKSIDLDPLETDFLSPAVANLLIGQVADFWVPFMQIVPDGGQILADTLPTALPGNPRMMEPLGASWNPSESLPALTFLATDVNRGNRFVMSAIGGDIAHNAEAFPSGNVFSPNDIAANQAGIVSARFPWLTSTARLQASDNDYRVLADGGYFENSGADTIVDLVENIQGIAEPCPQQMRRDEPDNQQCKCPIVVHSSFVKDLSWVGCEQHIYLIYIPIIGLEYGIPGYTYEDDDDPSQSYVLDPLRTMLATRTTRGQLALSRARRSLLRDDPDMVQGVNVHGGYFPHQMPIAELNLPLGWRLSSNALDDMRRRVVPTDKCGFLPGGKYFDDKLYAADDDKWWEKEMAEHAEQAPETSSEDEATLPGGDVDETIPDQPATANDTNHDDAIGNEDAAGEIDDMTAVEDNGCNMLLVAWLFNPEGRKDYYGIPAWGHP